MGRYNASKVSSYGALVTLTNYVIVNVRIMEISSRGFHFHEHEREIFVLKFFNIRFNFMVALRIT